MIWKSINGPTEVKDMDKSHVINVINFLVRKYGEHLTLNLILKGRETLIKEKKAIEKKKKEKEITFHTPVDAALHAMEYLNGDMACMDAENWLNNYMDPYNNDPYIIHEEDEL